MAVIDPVKLVIENYPQGESEMVAMPNHPNKPEMGSREVPFSAEIWIDRADFREEANKQYKRLVLGKKYVCATPTSSKRNAWRKMPKAISLLSSAPTMPTP